VSRRTIVDPRFPGRLRQLRKAHGLSLRELAARTHFGKSTLSELESGITAPSEDTAQRLDDALVAGGELARMVYLANGEVADAGDRLDYVARNPRRVDAAAVDTLAELLASQRRLEDSIGSAPLVTPVLAQLATVETLVRDAPDTDLKTRLVDVAGQWAQFAAWLSTTTGDHAAGRRLYLQAMEWATEAGNPHMVATALSMRGHLAWIMGRITPMIELSRAAQWQPASRGVRALATQQEARGLALVGDDRAVEAKMAEAEQLTVDAADHRGDEPPWMYFFDPDFLTAQRGLAQQYLQHHDRAVELLTDGLDRLAPEIRRADWIGWYVVQLAAAFAAAGERDEAVKALTEAREIADRANANRLRSEVDALARKLGL
jgi:transcriptional regulator with XRE-family HTH domain